MTRFILVAAMLVALLAPTVASADRTVNQYVEPNNDAIVAQAAADVGAPGWLLQVGYCVEWHESSNRIYAISDTDDWGAFQNHRRGPGAYDGLRPGDNVNDLYTTARRFFEAVLSGGGGMWAADVPFCGAF